MVFMPVFAIDLDYTVDDDIRKNYKVDEVKINNNKKMKCRISSVLFYS